MTLPLLALDPATKTGWAYLSLEGDLSWGSCVLKDTKNPGPGGTYHGYRTLLFGQDPRNPYDSLPWHRKPLASVWAESPLIQHVQAVRILYGLMGHLEHFCYIQKVPLQFRSPTAIKRWATGHGVASKQAMCERATELVGKVVEDADAADALCLLHLAIEEKGCPWETK